MEAKTRGSHAKWIALTALAPIAWGSNYPVMHHFLPADSPLWGAALRALPAGILLFLFVRKLPTGSWWWRAPLLGLINFCVFFVLVYVAAQLLPSSVAASIMAASPLVLGLLGWAMLGQRLNLPTLIGAVCGIVGVILIVGLSTARIDGWGVAASMAALLVFSIGSILTQRWRDDTPVLALTSWQLLFGGIVLVAVATCVEGAPPQLPPSGIAAILFVSIIATAAAYLCWFTGLAHLSPGVVGLVGLLNPVTGVLLGTVVAGESLAPAQLLGIALVLAGIVVGQRSPRRARSA
ncbi:MULTISPECIES: DMT family transporter [unclassified Leucobacter]